MRNGKAFGSALVPEDHLVPGIHGPYGIAALALSLFHLARIPESRRLRVIGSDFGTGVHRFFVLRAFSLMCSTAPALQRPTWASEYYVERLFRTPPLNYIIMAGIIVCQLARSAELTYRLVEVPAIRYRQQLNRRLRDGKMRTIRGCEAVGVATSKDEVI